MKKSISGKWLFKAADGTEWKKATVPGCNFLDLMENGEIPDPFYALNEKAVQWVGEKDWEYKRSFEITEEELESDEIFLNCEMLDTLCDVYINEKYAFSAENCFVAQSVAVKDFLCLGENEIRIYFHSAVNYVSEVYKKEGAPVNSNGQNGIVHIRKPQYHFGWDWGPVLPLCGICGEIELEFVSGGRIDFLAVEQEHTDGAVKISARAQVSLSNGSACEISLICPNGEVLTAQGETAQFVVENPILWWTYELSGKDKQPLYKVKAVLKNENGVCDEKEKRLGLRTVTLNREKDEYGTNFQFILNGVPLFIKGANYIPSDSFMTRFGQDKLKALLDAARFSNMNMLRVWGGGYYGSDAFYDLCDEMGILVWQDFQFACQAYPFFKESFLENVKKEVAYQVSRLSHHASLALWNGNNEIEDMHMAWVYERKYVDWTEKFFYHILEDEIRKIDKTTDYTQGSPIGTAHNKNVSSDNYGDTHLWGVWHGLQPMNYYRNRMTRFCSEFGFESLPDLKTIDAYGAQGDYSLDSEVFRAHQKCANGNDKMLYYIGSRFDLPEDNKDYVYLSQVTQLECIADATEHWRRNKGRCNGSMYWQFNDCWGVCSWSSIDYYGNYKALQYAARHFNAPLCVSAEDSEKGVKVFLLNDLSSEQTADVEAVIFDFEKGVIQSKRKTVTVGKTENRQIFDIAYKPIFQKYNRKTTGVCLKLWQNGELVMQRVVLPDREKKLRLPKATLTCKMTAEKEQIRIEVSSDCFARLVKIESERSTLPTSDNFFDILPGESKTVTMPLDKSMTAEEQLASLKVYSLCDIRPSRRKLLSQMKRYKVYLSATNLSNAVYHGRKSGE